MFVLFCFVLFFSVCDLNYTQVCGCVFDGGWAVCLSLFIYSFREYPVWIFLPLCFYCHKL